MTDRTIAEWVAHLNRLDVKLWVEGDSPELVLDKGHASFEQIRLRCNAPEGTLTSELRQELADRKAELILYLSQVKAEETRKKTADSRQEIEKRRKLVDKEELNFYASSHAFTPLPIPLSFAQQRLWFLYQLAPDNPFYNVPTAIRFIGMLDQTALERSFDAIVCRHAALRTHFTYLDGQPVQIVGSEIKIERSVVDLSRVAVRERERVSQQLATAEAQRPFNLTTDPLLRVTLLQFAPTESVLLLTMHHIVADGWSLGVLIRELACCYTAFVEGRSPELPALPMQYPDFAEWQRNWLQGEVLEKQLTYWRKQLKDLPVLHLPSDRPRPAVQTYRGATCPLQISPALTQALVELSQQSGVSLFMTLLAAFQTLLYRYTGQTDVAIGSPIANRHHSELEDLIGFFVNSLVMRSDLSGNLTFRELLGRVRTVALEAYEHQDLPFEKLVEELEPDRDLSRNPLFQVAFALQNAPMQPLELPQLRLEPAPLESGSTRFDLEVHLWEPAHGLRSLWQSQAGLSGFISYSTDLFDRGRILRLIGHFQTLLEGIVAHPDDRLSELPLLPTAEYQQIAIEWNQFAQADAAGSRQDRCFHHIFEAQVQQAPEAIALVSEQGSLTYKALNQQADRLAQTLQNLGVQPHDLVGLCLDRSADLIIGILGILKAGAAYVPLDPNYPVDRLQLMLNDTQVAILLTQSSLVESLPPSSAQILCLDHPLPQVNSQTTSCLELEKVGYTSATFPGLGDLRGREDTVTPDHLAYVIYTSGSTGTPKGVLLTHRGLCNVVEAQQRVFQTCRSSRILQFSSLSFDASIFEIALAFSCGGTLYIPPKSAQLPGTALIQFLADRAITHALLTPSVLAVLPAAELPALQVLITGGEACSSAVVDRWAADRCFFNAYGPTETTIWATVAQLHPGDHPLIIGRPILNTQVYILDAHLNPLPVGIPGELYIGSVGLARGYLNRPELTAERFIEGLSSRLYKTGDRAQYRSDGAIEFLGRVDDQIKLRGFRVELGEIETTLQRHAAIQDAVVVASGVASSEKRLIAYFSLDRQCLQQSLHALQTQQIHHWQSLYDQTYQLPITPHPSPLTHSTFNITGWNSSYTGEPIPPEQMQEWVSDRVQQILALKPKRVLEIGCGTGLLLFQIAPHCQQYVGTDFSTVSLQGIQHQLDRLDLPQVKLLHRMATDFSEIDLASFDVVILNSIVQYFPSADYLMQVLEGAIQTIVSGGVLLIGDVRSLPLLRAFHSWVQFSQAEATLERSQLQYQVDRSQFEDPELTIDPAFFYALRRKFPQIQHVQTRLLRGYSHNEMTQFRYNVLLHMEPAQSYQDQGYQDQDPLTSLQPDQHHNWQLNPIDVAAVQKHLMQHQPEMFIITDITNSRVNQAIKTATWLRHQTTPKTVGQMRDRLQSAELAIDPQAWWDLETELPYTVEISWATPTHSGNYDVLFIRHHVEAKIDLSPQCFEQSEHHYTNHPLQSSFARQLIPELRQYLRKTLPDYMVPVAFVPLETLPITPNGKVDRTSITEQSRYLCPTLNDNSIPALNTAREQEQNHSSKPPTTELTATELTLIDIWKELLRLNQVNVHDNFFELGGHSLLATQMTSRVRDAFGLELPLQSVFESPTIAQLAPTLETLRDTTSTPKIPPLVRLDRSIYRRNALSAPAATPANPNPSLPQDLSAPVPSSPVAATHSAEMARSPLVPLTLQGNKPPFFCVHPMFGVVFPYLELAHHLGTLGSDRSFYGLQPLGLDGKAAPLNRIETIAAYYIEAIQSLQPQGPYFLGGWSFGGLVAFEMAQQLTQAGHAIGLLAILDTPTPCHHPSLFQSLKFLVGTALWSTLPFLRDYSALATQRLQSRNTWLSRWQWSAIVRMIPEESRLQLLDESVVSSMLSVVYANAQAAYRYVPQHYPNSITLFKATEQSDAIGRNPTLGWDALASHVRLHPVPGNHLSLLKQPHVQTLAHELGQCLS